MKLSAGQRMAPKPCAAKSNPATNASRPSNLRGAFMCEPPRLASLPGTAVLDRAFDLRAQFRTVLVPMHRYRVLDRRVQDFHLTVGADRDRALHLTRKFTAIDEFSCHRILPA